MADLKPGNASENEGGVVEITVRTIGPSPPSRLSLPSTIKVRELRRLIAGNSLKPIEEIKLIFRGNVLSDNANGDDLSVQFQNGESIIVAIKPKPPSKLIQDNFDDNENEDKFQLPESTSRWKKRLFYILHDKLKLPDMLLMAIFSVKLKMWLAIVGWLILAHVAQQLDVAPLYILGTGFIIIFCNLGHRQPGDISAYSIFNEDFRELPGTLNADRLDRDIRNGQF
ncbi:uncharacterized protein LOC142545429 isoform X2 [Primulina tabacum]|uniref:uncharacterized protein LOC142545429 isoform X2 n=1 Tax=Primulina tabacum TaxID=48773 RepID=UPI003F5A3B5B